MPPCLLHAVCGRRVTVAKGKGSTAAKACLAPEPESGVEFHLVVLVSGVRGVWLLHFGTCVCASVASLAQIAVIAALPVPLRPDFPPPVSSSTDWAALHRWGSHSSHCPLPTWHWAQGDTW